MAQALFFGLPLHGHTNPALPLVRALVDRGDSVVYYSTETFARAIAEAGAQYREYRAPFLRELTRLPEHMDDLASVLMRATADVLDSELAEARGAQPDYLIADSVAPWGQWIGQILEVPVITSITTFAVNRQVVRYAVSEGNRPKSATLLAKKIRSIAGAYWLGRGVRRRYGVAGTGVMGLAFGQSNLNVVYTSRAFQPCADTFDERFVFIGPPVLALTTLPAAPAGTRVYVSLGTLFNTNETFYRQCFDAFGGRPMDVMMSVGTGLRVESLGVPPKNVQVRPSVNQLDVLQRASVFVTHGGMNSVSESVCCGVPMVVVPQMSEQRLVGRRVAELGAGVMLETPVSAADLRAAVERVLAERRFREGALALRQSFVDAGGVAAAVAAIHRFARGG